MRDWPSTNGYPRVRILTPVYNEEKVLPMYVDALRRVLFAERGYDFRVLFIDDGSTDDTWRVVSDICAHDSRFDGVRLSRNYGAHVAETAGLDVADGDCFVTLACDLQDPPEAVPDFLRHWQDGSQIVWGKRRTRVDSLWRVATSNVFMGLLRRFAMPKGSRFTTGGFLLMDRKVADCVRRFPEHSRITFALVAWTGFRQSTVEYDRRQRVAGVSGWSLGRMIKTMYDAFIGFSYLPVRLMTVVGLAAFLVSLVLMGILIYGRLTGSPVPGWTSTMLGMAFFFGLQFLLMGVSGEYLHRIYQEVVRRPLYFISDETAVPHQPLSLARDRVLS